MTNQQGDVLLFQTNDGGDINVEDGVVEMTPGLGVAAYLALFGGNEDDDGRDENPHNWWGNIDETEPSRRYRSETQHLLQSIPAVTGNLRRIEDAALRDLNFFLEDGIASSVSAEASIPAVNTVMVEILIEAQGVESSFAFTENWKAST